MQNGLNDGTFLSGVAGYTKETMHSGPVQVSGNPPSVEALLAARVSDTRSKKSPTCELERSGAPAEETDRRFHFPLHLVRISSTQGKADECVGPVGVPGAKEPGWMQLPECSWGRPGEAANGVRSDAKPG